MNRLVKIAILWHCLVFLAWTGISSHGPMHSQLDNVYYYKVTKDEKSFYVLGSCHIVAYWQIPKIIRDHLDFNVLATELDLQVELPKEGQKIIALLQESSEEDSQIFSSLSQTHKEKLLGFMNEFFYLTNEDEANFLDLLNAQHITDNMLMAILLGLVWEYHGMDYDLYRKSLNEEKEVMGLESFSDRQDLSIATNFQERNERHYSQELIEIVNHELSTLLDLHHTLSDFAFDVREILAEKLPCHELDIVEKYILGNIAGYISKDEGSLILRNNLWLGKIIDLHQQSEKALVVFGALHLYGQHGVLQLLLDNDFVIEQIVIDEEKELSFQPITESSCMLDENLYNPSYFQQLILRLLKETIENVLEDLKQVECDIPSPFDREDLREINGRIGKLAGRGTNNPHFVFDLDCLEKYVECILNYMENSLIHKQPNELLLGPLNKVHMRTNLIDCSAFLKFAKGYESISESQDFFKKIIEYIKPGGELFYDLHLEPFFTADSILEELIAGINNKAAAISTMMPKRLELTELVEILQSASIVDNKISPQIKAIFQATVNFLVRPNDLIIAQQIVDNWAVISVEEILADETLCDYLISKNIHLIKRLLDTQGLSFKEQESVGDQVVRLHFIKNECPCENVAELIEPPAI